MCVCVSVYLLMRHLVPTRIVKPEMFDIVGTGLRVCVCVCVCLPPATPAVDVKCVVV